MQLSKQGRGEEEKGILREKRTGEEGGGGRMEGGQEGDEKGGGGGQNYVLMDYLLGSKFQPHIL